MPNILKFVELCATDEVTRAIGRDPLSVKLTDDNGNTPLHLAFAKGNGALVMTLINSGADPTKLNSEGKKPLELKRDGIDSPVLQLFKKYESNYSATTRDTTRVQPDGPLKMHPSGQYEVIDLEKIAFLQIDTASEQRFGEYRGIQVLVDSPLSELDQPLLKALSRLRHPNICMFIGVSQVHSPGISLVCERCLGGSLKGAMNSIIFSEKQKMKILSDITRAMYYLHSQKPHLTMPKLSLESLALDTIVVLDTDFVCVKISDLTGFQLRGDTSKDILALGQIASAVFPDMPAELRSIFDRCLSANPSQRPNALDVCRVIQATN